MGYTRNKKILKLTVAQRSYIAAIVDGEGCIALSRKRDKELRSGFAFRPHVHVSNTCEILLVTMQRWTGLGNVCAFVPKKERNRKPTWQWQVWSNQAKQVLDAILPFLIVKKKKAKLLLKFINKNRRHPGKTGLTKREWNFQISIHSQIKKLNQKGLIK